MIVSLENFLQYFYHINSPPTTPIRFLHTHPNSCHSFLKTNKQRTKETKMTQKKNHGV